MGKLIRTRGRRKQTSIFAIVLMIFLIWMIIFMVFAVIAIIKEPFKFSIFLLEDEIPKGTDGLLEYKVLNFGFRTIKNVTITIELVDDSERFEKNFKRISFLDEETGDYSFKTDHLMRKEYTIQTYLKYSVFSKEKIKPLSLGFKVT